MEQISGSLLDQALVSKLNIALIGEAAVGKEWTARLLHSQKGGDSFSKYDCLVEEVGKWCLVSNFARDFYTNITKGKNVNSTWFLRDIHFLDRHQVVFLQEHFLSLLNDDSINSHAILHSGLICSCHPERLREYPWRHFVTQFFPYEISVPPLRERLEELPSLVSNLIQECAAVHTKSIAGIEPGAVRLMLNYAWPGNIAELKSVIQFAVALTDANGLITPEVIEERLRTGAVVRQKEHYVEV